MKKIKDILLQIIDFVIAIIVFFGAIYGIALLTQNLFNFSNSGFSIIISLLLFARFVTRISNKE